MTARVLLSGDGQQDADGVARALDAQGLRDVIGDAASSLSSTARKAVGDEVSSVAHRLLDVDVADAVLAGWTKHTDLIQAARRTRETPGSREILDLATHRITATHESDVDFFIDELRIAHIVVRLSLDFEVKGLVAIVGDGRLTAIAGGSCTVTVTLTAKDRRLLQHKGSIDLPLTVRLGAGFALLPDETTEPADAMPPRPSGPAAGQPGPDFDD
jgi:hypothetical protein